MGLLYFRTKTHLSMSVHDRTTAVGLFNYAASYRGAADALGTIAFKTTHPGAPRGFLYAHSIELYVKAMLRARGYTGARAKTVGHDWRRLRDAFVSAGGSLDDEDEDVFGLLGSVDATIRFRYIETGLIRLPTSQALARTARSLHKAVKAALRHSGYPVR